MQPTAPSATCERFSTRGLQASQRLELWEEHNARALVGLECRTLDGSPLEAREVNVRVGALRFAHVSATTHTVERSARQIARTATDGIAMYFTLAGESFFYHSDGVHLLAPGRVLVCDADRPFMRGFARGLKELVVIVPRARFATLGAVGRLDAPTVTDFSSARAGDPAARALARLVRETLADPDRQPDTTTEASALLMLHEMFSLPAERGDAAHYRRALQVIEARLTDASLTVGDVAAACGLSTRHLSRVFAEHGEDGIARTILESRLVAAQQMLLSRPGCPVGDVAASCGFTSHSHFTRAFHARFGLAPAAARGARST